MPKTKPLRIDPRDVPTPQNIIEHFAEQGVGGSGDGGFITGRTQSMAREIIKHRAGPVVAPLKWEKIGIHEWVAETPASRRAESIWCCFEQGKYWTVWDCNLPGYDTLEEAMAEGQKYHDAYIKEFVSKYTC